MQETAERRRTMDEGRGRKERQIRNPKHDPSASLWTRILNKFEIQMFKRAKRASLRGKGAIRRGGLNDGSLRLQYDRRGRGIKCTGHL